MKQRHDSVQRPRALDEVYQRWVQRSYHEPDDSCDVVVQTSVDDPLYAYTCPVVRQVFEGRILAVDNKMIL